MELLFGKQKTPGDQIKEYNRSIKKSIRELDRERTALERQEKKLMGDIKKAAKDGHMDSAKIMAKDLVRTRSYIKKMYKMKSHMEAVSLRLQTMSSSQQMAQCMKGVTKAMGMMNRKVCTPGRTAAHSLAHPAHSLRRAPASCTDEPATNPEDYDGVRKAKRDDGCARAPHQPLACRELPTSGSVRERCGSVRDEAALDIGHLLEGTPRTARVGSGTRAWVCSTARVRAAARAPACSLLVRAANTQA